ncbi:MAG: zinc ribbon domain-containing protein [Bacillota bacterium]
MKLYSTLYQAAEFAATLSANWSFATADENYDRNGLLGIAEIHDAENPADEDSFYLVSPYGSIGFCQDDEEIDWLFLADSGAGEDLPATFSVAPEIKFCPKCGSKVIPGARFCGKCGEKLFMGR